MAAVPGQFDYVICFTHIQLLSLHLSLLIAPCPGCMDSAAAGRLIMWGWVQGELLLSGGEAHHVGHFYFCPYSFNCNP